MNHHVNWKGHCMSDKFASVVPLPDRSAHTSWKQSANDHLHDIRQLFAAVMKRRQAACNSLHTLELNARALPLVLGEVAAGQPSAACQPQIYVEVQSGRYQLLSLDLGTDGAVAADHGSTIGGSEVGGSVQWSDDYVLQQVEDFCQQYVDFSSAQSGSEADNGQTSSSAAAPAGINGTGEMNEAARLLSPLETVQALYTAVTDALKQAASQPADLAENTRHTLSARFQPSLVSPINLPHAAAIPLTRYRYATSADVVSACAGVV